jgi:antirestriction protein ArdC
MSRSTARARTGRDRPSLYQEITDKIIAELEAGRVPWVQPWGTVQAKASLSMPSNAATHRKYSGINVLILWSAVIEHGFSTQNWLTFRQALGLGANVRKGEHGTTVVYADRFVPDEERQRAERDGDEPSAIPFLKRFTVFNTDQCENLPPELTSASAPVPEGFILPHAEALIRAAGIEFRIGGERAFYSPDHDFIQVPRPEAYFEPINWHRTALHELAHNAVIRFMPHGLRRRLVFRASAMRLVGIIKALPRTRGAGGAAVALPSAWPPSARSAPDWSPSRHIRTDIEGRYERASQPSCRDARSPAHAP